MKQFQFSYNDNDDLKTTLTKIRLWCSSSITSHIVFQIYTETIDNELISEICSVIAAELPDAEYLGCSTNGNIINGEFSGSAVNIICTIFEYPISKVEIFQYALTAQTENKVMRNFLKEIEMILSILLYTFSSKFTNLLKIYIPMERSGMGM